MIGFLREDEGEGEEGEGGAVVGEAGVEVKGFVAEEELGAVGLAGDAELAESTLKSRGKGLGVEVSKTGGEGGVCLGPVAAEGTEEGEGLFGGEWLQRAERLTILVRRK